MVVAEVDHRAIVGFKEVNDYAIAKTGVVFYYC